MEYSYRYRSCLEDAFKESTSYMSGNEVPYSVSTFNDGNIFNRLFVITIPDEGDFEVPIFVKGVFERSLNEVGNFTRISLPMYCNSCVLHKRTSDSIVIEFFRNTDFQSRLRKIVTNKGEIYYGGKGIILDKDFTPLILYSLMCRKNDSQRPYSYHYYRPIIHLNPKVFTDTSSMINKSIIKKIVPYHLTTSVYDIMCNDKVDGTLETRTPSIIIDDVSSYIVSPPAPSPNKDVNAEINDLLESSEQELLRVFNYD